MLALGTKVFINPNVEFDECTEGQLERLTELQRTGCVGEVIWDISDRPHTDDFVVEVKFTDDAIDEATDEKYHEKYLFWFRESELIIL